MIKSELQTMKEANLSKLWYISDAIVNNPKNWKFIIETVDGFITNTGSPFNSVSLSSDFINEWNALKKAFMNADTINYKTIRDIGIKLNSTKEPYAPNAGRALLNALNNHGK